MSKHYVKSKWKKKTLFIGNLYAKRDWGHAKDFVEAMADVTKKETRRFVIVTGNQTTVKNFINIFQKSWIWKFLAAKELTKRHMT